jgi:mannosyltransferase
VTTATRSPAAGDAVEVGHTRARLRAFVARHALAEIVLLGALLRFGTLTTQGFWLDEQVTISIIQRGPTDLLSTVQAGESNPALYYLLAGGWERVFGAGEFGLRSLSALAGTLVIPAVYVAAASLATRRAALIAAALTAASPMLVWYSQEARNYELLVLFSALTFMCFAKALEPRGERWLWAWALSSTLALGTHYFAIFLIAAEAVWLLARRPGRRFDTALPVAVVAAVELALLPLIASQRGHGDWIDNYDLGGRLWQVPQHLLAGLEVPWPALPPILIALAVGAAAYGCFRAKLRERRAIVIAGSIFLGALAVLVLAALAGSDYILSRNLLGLWPPLAVGLGAALGAAGTRMVGVAAAGVICAVGVALVLWTAFTPAAQRPDYEPLAAELADDAAPRLIVSQTSFSSPLLLYLDGLRIAADADLATSELVVVAPTPTSDYAVGVCWWIATCGNVDVEPPPQFEVPPGFTEARSGSAGSFAYRVYTAPQPVAIERPLELFTPRVFAQTPSGG